MKYLKGKLWQIGFIITKIVKDVYYGIKWFLFYNPSAVYKDGDPITKHPDYDKIIENINNVSYNAENNLGIQKIGYLDVDELQIPVPVFTDNEKKSIIEHYSGMGWDDILKKAEKDLKIKFTKPQKKAILKATDPTDFNTTKKKIKEIYEKKQSRKKSKKVKKCSNK